MWRVLSVGLPVETWHLRLWEDMERGKLMVYSGRIGIANRLGYVEYCREFGNFGGSLIC